VSDVPYKNPISFLMASLAIARIYQHSFSTHPNFTLAITGGSLNALADGIAQLSQDLVARRRGEVEKPYDFLRTLRFFCFGCMISPFLGRWNNFLERRFPLRTLPNSNRVSLRALSKRVACDQIIMAPIGLSAFIVSIGLMEGRDPTQIREKMHDLFKPTILTNWKVWPLAQLINFRYMPLPYRVPFQSTCGVFWTLYLSIINSREDDKLDACKP
jgi:protein Mpv17